MYFEEQPPSTNDQMFALAGIADMAFSECCLTPGNMSMNCVREGVMMEIVTDHDISVMFMFNDDNTWTGYAEVSRKSKSGLRFQASCYKLDNLIDLLMDAKRGVKEQP